MQGRLTFKNSSDPAPEKDNSRAEISLIELAHLALRKRYLLAIATLSVMTLVAVGLFLIPNKFQSTASILPSGQTDKLGALKELAGLGNLAAMSEENSSQLFPSILRSNQVKDPLLKKDFVFEDGGETKRMTLPEYFDDDDPDRLRKALDKLTDINMDKKTGVIRLGVETEYPAFSQAILKEMLAELENFNLHKRRSQAKNRENYLAREMAVRETELKEAERKLEEFQAVNRDWDVSSDPELLRILMQMKRDIEIKSKTYIFLREQYEIAKLEVQKDLPVVVLLDEPTLPTQKSGPHRLVMILLAGVMTFVISFLGLFLADSLRKNRDEEQREAINNFRDDFLQAFPVVNRVINGLTKKI